MSTTFVNGNSRADSLEEVKEKKLTDAVILVIRGEDEEEESSNEKCDTPTDPSTISTLSSFRSNSSEVSAFKKKPTGSNLIQMTDLESSPKSKVLISTSSGQHQTPPEIKNLSTPALNGKSLNWSNSHQYIASSAPNNKVSATTTPEKGTSPITKPKTPLVASQGLAGGDDEEDEEDDEDDEDDSYTDNPITTKTPLMASPDPEGGKKIEADDDIYKIKKSPKLMKSWCKKMKSWVLVEWIALVSIMGLLIASLTNKKVKNYKILKLHTGKWCVLLLVIVCGRLVTDWFINGIVFLINRNFFLKRKVLYYVYGLKNSFRVCIWLGLVLLSWVLLLRGRLKQSERIIWKYVTRGLVSILMGAIIWLIKNTLVMILAASVNVKSFFDRIQESLYNQYYLHTLSGPEKIVCTKIPGQLNVRSVKNEIEGEGQEMIDVAKLCKLKSGKVSAWTMKLLSNVICTTKLSTISSSIKELDGEESKQKDVEINCEWDAKAAAVRIFKNVAKPGSKFIYHDDLLRFLSNEEVDKVFELCERSMVGGKISKSMLRSWAVKVYLERKLLAHSLNDTQTAVQQLNKVASVIVLVVIFIAWLLLLEIATTELLLFISSQMILIVFVFGNTAKNVFEGIIFVFVIHPFDVGDRCVIDGIQMIVEEISIFSTVFLRYDNQKIYYPNSVLATRCIGNMYRSPCMGDFVEFTVNVSTKVERIVALKARIKSYIQSKPQYWNRSHNIVLLEIENASKMKMALHVTHTMNHQNMEKKNNRRSELVFELKKIFEELSVGYQVLPQEVQACYKVDEEQ